MKSKLLTTALLFAIALSASAQTEKGKNLIGGAISYNRTSGKSDNTITNNNSNNNGKTYSITVAPMYGHFVHKNLAIGLQLGYSYTKQNDQTLNYSLTPSGVTFITVNTTGTAKVYYGGPFIRHYIDLADKFKIYNQFAGNIGRGNQTISSQSSTLKSKYTSYGAAINSGLTFFPVKKLAVELGFDVISYNSAKTTTEQNNTASVERSNTFNFGLSSFNPSLGVNFHF